MLTISYALWYKIYTDIVMRFLEYYYVVPHFRYTVYYFRFFGLYSGTWQQACGLRVCQEEGRARKGHCQAWRRVNLSVCVAYCTFHCVIRPIRQMSPIRELSTSDLWWLISQRHGHGHSQRQRSRCRRMRHEQQPSRRLWRASLFAFSAQRVFHSNFPPDNSRHASPLSW